jgi:hypothetical protein
MRAGVAAVDTRVRLILTMATTKAGIAAWRKIRNMPKTNAFLAAFSPNNSWSK